MDLRAWLTLTLNAAVNVNHVVNLRAWLTLTANESVGADLDACAPLEFAPTRVA